MLNNWLSFSPTVAREPFQSLHDDRSSIATHASSSDMRTSIFPLVLLCLWTGRVTGDEIQLTKEFLTSGLTRIFWKSLQPEIRKSVSNQCFESLSQTLRGLHHGDGWAFACKSDRLFVTVNSHVHHMSSQSWMRPAKRRQELWMEVPPVSLTMTSVSGS